jgi:hypothetical protein
MIYIWSVWIFKAKFRLLEDKKPVFMPFYTFVPFSAPLPELLIIACWFSAAYGLTHFWDSYSLQLFLPPPPCCEVPALWAGSGVLNLGEEIVRLTIINTQFQFKITKKMVFILKALQGAMKLPKPLLQLQDYCLSLYSAWYFPKLLKSLFHFILTSKRCEQCHFREEETDRMDLTLRYTANQWLWRKETWAPRVLLTPLPYTVEVKPIEFQESRYLAQNWHTGSSDWFIYQFPVSQAKLGKWKGEQKWMDKWMSVAKRREAMTHTLWLYRQELS